MSTVIGVFPWLAVIWEYVLIVAVIGHAWCRVVRQTPWVDRMWRLCARLHQELWIVAGPAIVAGAAHDWRGSPVLVLSVAALSLFMWWWFRDWPDENRWRRRRRKVREAVARRGARLVVVPQ